MHKPYAEVYCTSEAMWNGQFWFVAEDGRLVFEKKIFASGKLDWNFEFGLGFYVSWYANTLVGIK